MNERSPHEHEAMSMKHSAPDSVSRIQYDDLKPVVRSHVDNLTEQLRQLVHKYGKKTVMELKDIAASDEMSLEDTKKFSAISKAMTEMFEKNVLPSEMKQEARELRHAAERMFGEATVLWDRDGLESEFFGISSENKISVTAAFDRMNRPNNALTLTTEECIQVLILENQFDVALTTARPMRNFTQRNFRYLDIARAAWKVRNEPAFEKALEVIEADDQKDRLLMSVLDDLLKEKNFDMAEYVAEFGYRWTDRGRLFLKISSEMNASNEDAVRFIQKAEDQAPDQYISDSGLFNQIAAQYARLGMVDDAKRMMQKGLSSTDLIAEIAYGFAMTGHDEEALRLGSKLGDWEVTRRSELFGMIALAQAQNGRNSDKALSVAKDISEIFSDPLASSLAHTLIAQVHLYRGEQKDLFESIAHIKQHIPNITSGHEQTRIFTELMGLAKKMHEQKVDLQEIFYVMYLLAESEKSPTERYSALLRFATFLHSIHQTNTNGINFEDMLTYARESAEEMNSPHALLEVARVAHACKSEFVSASLNAALRVAREIDTRAGSFDLQISVIREKAKLGFDVSNEIRFFEERTFWENPDDKTWKVPLCVIKMNLVNIFLDRAEVIERAMKTTA